MTREAQRELTQASRQSIKKGSKSFALASLLFSKEVMHASHLLYRWCRFCDDYIDECEPGADLKKRVEDLHEWTQGAIDQKENLPEAFLGLSYIISDYSIPSHYPLELIAGMEMDILQNRYQNLSDLELYCYRVASTVGLMMCHIMGLANASALKNASDMGIAMQLTNISRDVLDDLNKDRIYLPLDWLSEAGVDPSNLETQRKRVAEVVLRLLRKADEYYRSGDEGLRFLNWTSALAVCSAKNIYREIGLEVAKRGEAAWDQRCFVPLWKKLILISRSFLTVFRAKAFTSWKAVKLEVVWKHSS